ncbi:MAG: glutathione S-transferase N-terminal domain-containing protein [Solirubrobacterales bacterium]
MSPTITLHAVPPSHPCMTVAAALELKGLAFERIDFPHTERLERMQEIYGEGNSTVPGVVIDGEPVHGSRPILARLEQLAPEPTLFPSEEVREAERWGDEELQDLGRCLPWGAMYFRPESMGTFAGPGAQPLDGPGTDFAIKFVRATWRYHGITAARLHDDLAGLPAKVEQIERLAEHGVLGGEQPNAADLQIGATIRVLLPIADLRPLLAGTAGERIAMRWFAEYPGEVPAGAYPAGWAPTGS